MLRALCGVRNRCVNTVSLGEAPYVVGSNRHIAKSLND